VSRWHPGPILAFATPVESPPTMPRLKLTTNIGSRDAVRFNLDVAKAIEGNLVNVEKDAADEMLRRGWATADVSAKAISVTTAEVDDEDGDAGPDFDAMTKEELKEFADENEIAGVNMAMSKADMTAAVKKGFKAL
jgi:hypothetical protein